MKKESRDSHPNLRNKATQFFNDDDTIKAEVAINIRRMRFNGMSQEQVAKGLGISKQTLYRWKARYGDFRDALKNGQDEANGIVENHLFKMATSGNNVTATIFWLKNNYPEKYSDTKLSAEEKNAQAQKARKLKAEADFAELRNKQYESIENKSTNIVVFDDIPEGEDNGDQD